ncbi:MAG TPA: LytR C-terminal domain-containing protein [Bacteroidota bacterium]|nr:LytR C-terminal domain-containing protein [Bacteroidota bacterium]
MKESRRPAPKRLLLNLLLVVVAAFVLYQVLAISLPSGSHVPAGPGRDSVSAVLSKNVIQVDVLNGCGASGVGQKLTNLLRASGYDVVEMGNYKTFDVRQTLVVDRSGNIDIARKLASDLGIDARNVVQEISPGYFVTASVVLGKDFKNLRGWK